MVGLATPPAHLSRSTAMCSAVPLNPDPIRFPRHAPMMPLLACVHGVSALALLAIQCPSTLISDTIFHLPSFPKESSIGACLQGSTSRLSSLTCKFHLVRNDFSQSSRIAVASPGVCPTANKLSLGVPYRLHLLYRRYYSFLQRPHLHLLLLGRAWAGRLSSRNGRYQVHSK